MPELMPLPAELRTTSVPALGVEGSLARVESHSLLERIVDDFVHTQPIGAPIQLQVPVGWHRGK